MFKCALVLIFGRCSRKIEAWRIEYNEYRPHSSLDGLTPVEFIKRMQKEKEIKKALPGAPSSDPMIFAAVKQRPAASEKSSDQLKVSKRFKTPKF
jgi:putative transposase